MNFIDRLRGLFARPETREAFEHRLRTGNVTFPRVNGEMDRQGIYEWVRAFFSLPDVELSRTLHPDGSLKTCYYRFDPAMEESSGQSWPEANYAQAPLRCGIGCGIPDFMYRPAMEYGAVHSLLRRFPEIADHFGVSQADLESREQNDNLRFLALVQSAHDMADDVENVTERLDQIAHDWSLRVVT